MPRVLVVGDVINDILAEVRGPLVSGTDNPAVIKNQPGGSAANQAAWLAALGVDVVFAGRVGAADAEYHRQALAKRGVRPHLTADEADPTGSIVVLIEPGGERTMITFRGANVNLRPADVPAALLDDADLLHLTGYTFFQPGQRAVARGLLAEAGRRGVPFTVDPGSAAFLAALAPGEFLGWTTRAALCFPNKDEAAVLAGLPRASAAEELARPLARHYGAVVLKLGPDGALIATAEGAGTEFVHVPAVPAVVVRDTTGAGDAFCAGFLTAWLSGASPAAAATAGTETAAGAVAALGGRPPAG